MIKLGKIAKFISAIAVCQLAGVIGSVFTYPAISTWYATIQKPAFTPPNWVFAPVWVILFLIMGVSAYLIWERGFGKKEVKAAMSIFGVQLTLNVLWSILFFGLQSPFYAFIEILMLWIAVAVTILKFYRISKKAGLLLLPYIIWVSFAASLNFSIWMLNL